MMARSQRPGLRLVRERKLAELIPPPRNSAVLEASGVLAKGHEYFVIFDNIRRVARIGADLVPGSGTHGWLGRWRAGEGYEDIAYSPHQRRFYLLIEAEKHPDGTYKAVIEECDETWRYKGRCWVDIAFKKQNTGFEGLSAVRWRGGDYLLALCEGNGCGGGRKGRRPGRGRIHVLQKHGRMWQSIAQIKLPRHVKFEDYSALALRGNRLAVVSQESSRMWVGTLRRRDWAVVGAGRTYDLPRTKKGKRLYCTVEGLAWPSLTTFVMVSDLRRQHHPSRCSRTDQSIHIFRVGKR
jgi:hypothetical protein